MFKKTRTKNKKLKDCSTEKSIMIMILTKFKEEFYSPESIVWRYLDFSKFVDMLDSKCLFFVRLSKLREFDPYEGIAIKSTVYGLSNSIASGNSEKSIWMGSVAKQKKHTPWPEIKTKAMYFNLE